MQLVRPFLTALEKLLKGRPADLVEVVVGNLSLFFRVNNHDET